MNLAEYRAIATALNADLMAAYAKHGLKLNKLKATVDPADGTVRYTITVEDMCLTDAKGDATTPNEARYKARCRMYDLKPEWLGQTFKTGTTEFTVTGLLDSRSEKNVAVTVDGKPMRISPSGLIRAALGPVRATLADNLIAGGK